MNLSEHQMKIRCCADQRGVADRITSPWSWSPTGYLWAKLRWKKKKKDSFQLNLVDGTHIFNSASFWKLVRLQWGLFIKKDLFRYKYSWLFGKWELVSTWLVYYGSICIVWILHFLTHNFVCEERGWMLKTAPSLNELRRITQNANNSDMYPLPASLPGGTTLPWTSDHPPPVGNSQ